MFSARITAIIIFSAALAACAGVDVDTESEAPKIIEVFACGDYCPGPEEQYLKRVYEGVTDEKECHKLGGRLYMWIDWQQRTVCEVR